MNWLTFLTGIIPSLGLLLICFVVFRGVIRADRNERAAIAQEEARLAQQERKAAQGDASASPTDQ